MKEIQKKWSKFKAFGDDIRIELEMRGGSIKLRKVHERTFKLPSQVLLGMLGGVIIVGGTIRLINMLAKKSKKSN